MRDALELDRAPFEIACGLVRRTAIHPSISSSWILVQEWHYCPALETAKSQHMTPATFQPYSRSSPVS